MKTYTLNLKLPALYIGPCKFPAQPLENLTRLTTNGHPGKGLTRQAGFGEPGANTDAFCPMDGSEKVGFKESLRMSLWLSPHAVLSPVGGNLQLHKGTFTLCPGSWLPAQHPPPPASLCSMHMTALDPS